ncbi:MAG TPA: hypothetical protein VJ754_00250 [Anaerolineae bacterium]|nr:hypothetical protein [Anaerolineae bacterium]
MNEAASSKQQERFKIVVAILLASVTVIGAIVALRAAIAADLANNADARGLAATLNAEETRALNHVNTYEHYRAYTTYLRHNELGNRIAEDLPTAAEDEAQALERQKTDAWDLAVEIQGGFFLPRYLDPDGSYDTQREIDEAWADAAQQKDLNPEPHFADADRLRGKSTTMVILLVPLTVALLGFTLAESMKHAFKYVLAAGGSLILAGSLAALLLIEFSL